MELDKIKIPCVSFTDVYETQFAKVDKYKHLRITGYSSEVVRISLEWSYDCNEICIENSMGLQRDTWATNKFECVAPYVKLRCVNTSSSDEVKKFVINVLGRYSQMEKEVKLEESERPKSPERGKSPFRRFVAHKREVKENPKPSQSVDGRLPPIIFKNSILYSSNINTVSCLAPPPYDGNQHVLCCRNGLYEWVVMNHL